MTLVDGRVFLFTEVAATMEPDWIKYQVREEGGAFQEGYVRSRELTDAFRALLAGAHAGS